MKLVKYALIALMNFVLVRADGGEDYITILNRFSNMTLDRSDEVYFFLDQYFKIGKDIPKEDLSLTLNAGIFDSAISIKEMRSPDITQKKPEETHKYLFLNASKIWEILEKKERKTFKAKITLTHKGVGSLCQNIMGIVLDVDNNEYYIPETLEPLNYLTGTVPNLPYSFSNVLNSDFKVKAEKYYSLDKEGQKTEIVDKLPFDYSVNNEKESIYHQWTTLITEMPVYWQIHFQGKYLLYITQENEETNPVLRVFAINQEGALELLKGIRLDSMCKNSEELRSEEMMGDTMILRCSCNQVYGYLFYKISVVSDKIVMVDKETLEKPYARCSKLFFDQKQRGFIPKMACIEYDTQKKEKSKDDKVKRMVILDIYDEPLEFTVNQITYQYSIEDLRNSMPGLDQKGKYVSDIPDVFFCRASKNIHININHRVYEADSEGNKGKEVMNMFQLFGFDKRLENYELKKDLHFNDHVEYCSTPESLLTFNKKDMIMRAHLNHTIYKMRTDFLKDVEIVSTFCMYEESKYVVIYREKSNPGEPKKNLRIAAYCTRYLYSASSRIFYVQEIPYPNVENVLPFHYQSSIDSLLRNKSMSYYFIIPPRPLENKLNYKLNKDGNNVDYNMQIREIRRDIDYPRIKMDFTDTKAGDYSVLFSMKSSFGSTNYIEVPFVIHPRQELNIKETLLYNKGITKQEEENNIFDLKSRLELTGNLLNGELLIDDREIKDQVKLAMPVNYLGYFSDEMKGTCYKKIYTSNNTIYSVTNNYLDVTVLDLQEKIKQKTFTRHNFNSTIDGDIIYLRAENYYEKENLKTAVFIMTKRAVDNKLNLLIFDISENEIIDKPSVLEIEESEHFINVMKVEVRKIEHLVYALMISINHNTIIEYHKIEKKSTIPKMTWEKPPRLQKIDEYLLGISNFVFIDFTTNIIASRIEVIIVAESQILFVRICSSLGTSLEFFAKGEMYRFCKFTKIECFYQENDGYNDWNVVRKFTDCIVGTEGIHMHRMTIERELLNPIPPSKTKKILRHGGDDFENEESKLYKIVDVYCSHFYHYPFNDPPTEITLGTDYFTLSSKTSSFVSIYDRDSNNDYSIGSIWRPYGVDTLIDFSRIQGKDYLIQSSQKSAGKIYGLGYFYLKFLNHGVSLKNATIIFNTKMLTSQKEITTVSKELIINKQPKSIEIEENFLDMCLKSKVLWFSIFGIIVVLGCCFVRKELKKSQQIRKRVRKTKLLRKIFRDLKRKEIIRRIKQRNRDLDDSTEYVQEENYGLIE